MWGRDYQEIRIELTEVSQPSLVSSISSSPHCSHFYILYICLFSPHVNVNSCNLLTCVWIPCHIFCLSSNFFSVSASHCALKVRGMLGNSHVFGLQLMSPPWNKDQSWDMRGIRRRGIDFEHTCSLTNTHTLQIYAEAYTLPHIHQKH